MTNGRRRIARRGIAAAAIAGIVAAAALAQAPALPAVGERMATGEAYVTLVKLQHQADASKNGRLLIAFEERGWKGMPIWESADGGDSWRQVTYATDPVRPNSRCQLHWQPHLIELPRAVGDMAAGTVLMAASAVCPEANSFRTQDMHLRLYTSADQGRSWTYRSEIVAAAGTLPVWEPNVRLLDDGKLVVYYSSEEHKDQGFNQLLSHRVSTDAGRTWGPEIRDVAFGGGVERPGMAIVDRMGDGRYVYSYESVDGPTTGDQVHVKFSRDGLDWGAASARGIGVQTDGGQYPVNCPVVNWFPVGGPKGVLVVSARGADGGGDSAGRSLFWNNNGGEGPWWEAPAPVQKRPNGRAGWTQALMLRPDGRFLHMTSSAAADAPNDAGKNEILFRTAAIDFTRYEAEDGRRTGATVMRDPAMSNGAKVRLGSTGVGKLAYRITVFKPGAYTLALTYADIGLPGTPSLSANGRAVRATSAPLPRDEAALARRNRDLGTRGTGETLALTGTAQLKAGENLIEVAGGAHALDIDYLQVRPTSG